jgi:uncharacterized RDD family membrane protein YckC
MHLLLEQKSHGSSASDPELHHHTTGSTEPVHAQSTVNTAECDCDLRQSTACYLDGNECVVGNFYRSTLCAITRHRILPYDGFESCHVRRGVVAFTCDNHGGLLWIAGRYSGACSEQRQREKMDTIDHAMYTRSIPSSFEVDMEYASPFQRLFGQIIDGVIGAAPLVTIMLLGPSESISSIALIIGTGLWAGYYYFFADGFSEGQSYAKQWLGMRVIDKDSGAACTFGQSFIRNVILAALGPIDWVFIFSSKHQRLGDRAANTVVVQE